MMVRLTGLAPVPMIVGYPFGLQRRLGTALGAVAPFGVARFPKMGRIWVAPDCQVRLLPDVATENVAALEVPANRTTSSAATIWPANRLGERENVILVHLMLLEPHVLIRPT